MTPTGCPKHYPSIAQALLKPVLGNAPRNAQTDRQTYKQLLTLGKYLTLGNARRGGTRFLPISGKADAPRRRIGLP